LKILSVEDHELFRDGLRYALASLPDPPVLVEAHTGAVALKRLERDSEIGLALIDLGLPDQDGLDLLRTVRTRFPTVAVAVVSGRAAVRRAGRLRRRGRLRAPGGAGRAVISPRSADPGGRRLRPAFLVDADPGGRPLLSPRQRRSPR
jgi:DNA-binding NarL/FixJ family response regulator